MTTPSTKVPTAREVAHALILRLDGHPACPREDGGHSGRCEDVVEFIEARDATLRSAVAEECAVAAESCATAVATGSPCSSCAGAAERVRAIATRTGGNGNE